MFKSLVLMKDYVLCAARLGTTLSDSLSILWQETRNLRVRFKLDKHQPSRIVSFDTIYGKLYFRDNFGDITNLVNVLYRGEYHLRRLPYPGVVLDIGANIGTAAVWFAYHNPDRSIFCFEPLQQNVEMIRLNCPHAKIFAVALGATPGAIPLSVDANHVMASTIPCAWETEAREFPVETLDTIAERENWGEVALLKMDAEGMEVEILKGATKTLQKTHQIVVETHNRELHKQTLEILEDAGFRSEFERHKNETALLLASRIT